MDILQLSVRHTIDRRGKPRSCFFINEKTSGGWLADFSFVCLYNFGFLDTKVYLTATLLKNTLWHRCFPMDFAKFPRTLFFTEHLWTTASVCNHLLWCFCCCYSGFPVSFTIVQVGTINVLVTL